MSLRSINFDDHVIKGWKGESINTKVDKCDGKFESHKQQLKDVDPAADDNDADGTCPTKVKFVKEGVEYFYVGNIPIEYKSADLRAFFKDKIEENVFDCFHYRHRPEQLEIKQKTKNCDDNFVQSENEKTERKCCCIIRCKRKFSQDLYKSYHQRQWFDANRHFLNGQCVIQLLNVAAETNSLNNQDSFKVEENENRKLYLGDFERLIEFNPPDIMPQGNVGTPTKFFHDLIAKCLLPSSVIRKLGIEFPNKKSSRFSSVKLDYTILEDNTVYGDEKTDFQNDYAPDIQLCNYGETVKSKLEKREDDDAEEWDRYEALHDDVGNQGRLKERLFEEDIELKWEKGGSGLVFYTDAYYWNEMKGKDFDEDTVDDWDVDYSVYYEDNAGDKPSKDQLKMRIEKRRREGREDGPLKYSEIIRKEKHNRRKMTESFAEFEKYSKAFGSRILKQQGWNKGEGVGCSKDGLTEPLDLKGQLPKTKTGLGYYGEKLDRTMPLKRQRLAEKDVYISTKYDEKDGELMDAMRFHGIELLKYRTPKVEFEKSASES